MLRTRIKICGITRIEDALIAIDAGVDALGFVFVPESPRAISPGTAQSIIEQLPAYVETVALVMNPEMGWITEIANNVEIGCWQFHGQESATSILSHFDHMQSERQHVPRYTKAIATAGRSVDAITAEMATFPDAAALLIDGHGVGEMGGSGQQADWQALQSIFSDRRASHHQQLVLAGGIDAANCDQALSVLEPYAIDVSSGVEEMPGKKSADKMRHLCDTVKRFDTRRAASLSQ